MKQLTKDTGGGLRGKSTNSGNNEIQSISLAPGKSGAPKKKPVFKAIGSSNAAPAALPASLTGALDVNDPSTATEENDPSGAVRNGWYADRYEPELISGCDSSCGACAGREERIAI